jgi:outer membrane protein TolC
MSRSLKRHLLLGCIGGPIVLLMLFTRSVPAQSAPVSPDRPWHTSAELTVEADARKIPDLRFNIDATRTYALAELIDLAEAHNPATRVDWERARAQAGALGVTRSKLFPTLASAAVSQTTRQQTLFGNRFNGQEIQDFQVEMDLNYTVFDFAPARAESTRRKHSSWRLTSLSMTRTARSSTRYSSLTTGY